MDAPASGTDTAAAPASTTQTPSSDQKLRADVADALTAAGLATNGVARRHLLTAAAHARIGDGDVSGGVRGFLSLAREAMTEGRSAEGAQLFRQARNLAVEGQPPGVVDRVIANADAKLTKEAELFASAFSRSSVSRPAVRVVVLSDSLGLPRTDDGRWTADASSLTANALEAVADTYSGRILNALEARYGVGAVELRPFCRRFFTSVQAERWLSSQRAQLADCLILIHVGLNDCASRIFSERERHAVSLLSKDAQDDIVEFGRVYRVRVIHDEPEHNYVPLDEYRSRLEQSVKVARAFGARQVFLTTPIHPPLKVEQRTPHLRWNFTRYGFAAMDVAKRFSAPLIDVDRLCWGNDTSRTLQRDGMHLSVEGHRVLAESFLEQIKPYLPATA